MDRLKELGTWIILAIAFYLFTNGIIYIFLNQTPFKDNGANNTSVVNSVKK